MRNEGSTLSAHGANVAVAKGGVEDCDLFP